MNIYDLTIILKFITREDAQAPWQGWVCLREKKNPFIFDDVQVLIIGKSELSEYNVYTIDIAIQKLFLLTHTWRRYLGRVFKFIAPCDMVAVLISAIPRTFAGTSFTKSSSRALLA